MFMLSLEVVSPGDNLSTVLIATPYWRDANWRVLAGGNSDGGTQLRPDGGGASSLAGKRLAGATVERHWFSMAMD
jgi:hypothetical protein